MPTCHRSSRRSTRWCFRRSGRRPAASARERRWRPESRSWRRALAGSPRRCAMASTACYSSRAMPPTWRDRFAGCSTSRACSIAFATAATPRARSTMTSPRRVRLYQRRRAPFGVTGARTAPALTASDAVASVAAVVLNYRTPEQTAVAVEMLRRSETQTDAAHRRRQRRRRRLRRGACALWRRCRASRDRRQSRLLRRMQRRHPRRARRPAPPRCCWSTAT